MIVSFELSMPGNNAWDGKWSGAGRLYAKVVNVGTSAKARAKYEALCGKSFGYDFGDGWFASVKVREVTPAESRKLRKETKGFCGYDWMVESIRMHGKIQVDERKSA